MNHQVTFGSIVIIILLCSGCAQMTHLESAKTLEAGEKTIAVLGNVLKFGDLPLPQIIVNFNVGLENNLELSTAISSNLSGYLGLKGMIAGGQSSIFALAYKPAIDISPGLGGGIWFRPQLSSIGSVHPNENWTYFGEIKYLHQFGNEERIVPSASIGFIKKQNQRLDLKVGLTYFESRYINPLGELEFSIIQLGAGLNYRLGQEYKKPAKVNRRARPPKDL